MRIGIDLGGTKIEAVAIDGGGEVRRRLRSPTPRGYGDLLETIAAMVSSLRVAGDVQSIGVGAPGSLCPATGLVRNAENTPLDGTAFDRDLARVLGAPVRVANDAHCFALSEATDGSARDAQVVFGAILGTGVGGGLVVRRRLVSGRNGIAGEWGHNPLPWPRHDDIPSRRCYCGRSGCIERYLCGEALRRDSGGIDPAEVATRATAGEPAAVAALQRYANRLARALASVINLVDPDIIVLGGGLSNIEPLYTMVPLRWTRYIVGRSASTRLVRARHGDSSGVRGAAWLPTS